MTTFVAPAPGAPGAPGAPRIGRGWHLALWVPQVLLAGLFAFAGYTKLTAPLEALVQAMPYTADLPLALTRFIGAAELAGALGVILPAATRILPWLTPVAAAGLGAVMALAGGFHLLRGEPFALPVNGGLLVLALLVAWGRLRKAPIAPRD